MIIVNINLYMHLQPTTSQLTSYFFIPITLSQHASSFFDSMIASFLKFPSLAIKFTTQFELICMSQNELIRNSMGGVGEDDNRNDAIISLCQSDPVDWIKVQEKLKKIYAPVQYPTCGNYTTPDLRPIKERKIELGKKFIEEMERPQISSNSSFDGLYEYSTGSQKNSDNIIRQKLRLVGDLREEYYQQNGDFIIEKDLFSNELSKLANISLENNACLQTFQKNAIISERNNQKKQTPFQLELFVAGIHLNAHPLHSDEEKKFQELRPLLKQWAKVSMNPTLPEIAKELKFLEHLREDGDNLEEVEKKIDVVNKKYNEEKAYLQNLIKDIIKGNEELKDIRKRTGMETVPWKIQIKEYRIKEMPSYDIGVTPFQVNEKVVANIAADAQKEELRREEIRNQKYFLRIYANNYQVGQSQKVKLQWPSYKINFQQKFNILVYTAPATLKVEIIKSGFINTIVDTVFISVPGLNARSITSSEKRYSSTPFASNGPQVRKQIKDDVKKEERLPSAAPAGVLLHRMEWKGESNKMPIIATKTAEEETACTVQSQSEDGTAYEELFDGLDPRISHKQLKDKVQAQIKKAGDALLPFVDVQSARHLLLKMKHQRPELEKVQIPLNQEEIRNREDLQEIIQDQYNRVKDNRQSQKHCFSPLQGFFSEQPQIILQEIKEILNKVANLRGIASSGAGGNTRYKITQEIINQYIFQQMESPIAIFFKNLFTQKRKLGPQGKMSIQAKTKIDEMQINLHVRSAKNVPIRQSSFQRIKKFQDDENQFKQQQMMMQYNNNAGLFDKFSGYGQGFFRQQPNINMHGNTFFNAFQNQGRPNQEISYNDHINLDRVNGYIEFRYKRNLKRTRCFQGPFPQWNETLFFNYSMKHEETNLEKIMMGCENSLKVFVFDMIQESKPTQAIAQARVKKTKFYLGRIDIPLSFLVSVPSISGLFKIDRPLIGFGYGIRRSGLFDFQNQAEEQSKTQNPDIHTYINLDLFTQPIIDSLVAYNSDRKYVPNVGQNPLILQRANDWLESLNTKRYIRLWLNNLEGKSIFICRYLSQNICPPKLANQGNGSMIERCARFVSLIPMKFNCKLFEGTEEFHLKCDEFLNVKIGEDHGILLCNYFNFIDRLEGRRDYESLLIVCKSFPYGKCMFVLRRDKTSKNCEVWDPYKGECYYVPAKEYEVFCCFIKYEKQQQSSDKAKDICPIIEISCLVSRDNVYFNLQEETKVPGIDFDIEDEKLWKPFLSERTRNQLFEKGVIESIQTTINPQFYPDYHKVQSGLETQLNKYIRESLQKERRNHFKPYTFKLNDRITNIIYNRIMPLCQAFKVDNRTLGNQSKLYGERSRANFQDSVGKIQEERDKIKTELPHEKNLFGFTLQATYTTKEEILEKVRETQIHLDENQDIEFVLAVRCFEYPCMLVSVWIFIGVIG